MVSNLLSEVPSQNYFGFKDGRVAKTLEDLYSILSSSDITVFSEHVNDSKNDFADWIRNSVLHTALADKLAPIKNRDEYLNIFQSEIVNLKQNQLAAVSTSVVDPVAAVSSSAADTGLDSIDAELNSVLDDEILSAMNDSTPATSASVVASSPVVVPVTSTPVVVSNPVPVVVSNPVPVVAPVTSTPVVVSNPVPVVASSPVVAPTSTASNLHSGANLDIKTEEIYEFEEVFKSVLEDIQKDIFLLDSQ